MVCLDYPVFVEIRRLGVSGFLNLAVLPFRALLGKDRNPVPSNGGNRSVALLSTTPEGIATEQLIFTGNSSVCEAKAIGMIGCGERIVLEGFPLEQVAELCFKHNYRWRFGPDSKKSLRFVLEPGKATPSSTDTHR